METQEETPTLSDALDGKAPLRMLWWYQPFASLMLPPYNKVETRNRPTNVRGWVLICATKKPLPSREMIELCGGAQALDIEVHVEETDHYQFSSAIAVGYLHDCRTVKRGDKTYLKPEVAAGRWAWIFRDVQPIEPFAVKGKQGWAFATSEIAAKVKLLPEKPEQPTSVVQHVKQMELRGREFHIQVPTESGDVTAIIGPSEVTTMIEQLHAKDVIPLNMFQSMVQVCRDLQRKGSSIRRLQPQTINVFKSGFEGFFAVDWDTLCMIGRSRVVIERRMMVYGYLEQVGYNPTEIMEHFVNRDRSTITTGTERFHSLMDLEPSFARRYAALVQHMDQWRLAPESRNGRQLEIV